MKTSLLTISTLLLLMTSSTFARLGFPSNNEGGLNENFQNNDSRSLVHARARSGSPARSGSRTGSSARSGSEFNGPDAAGSSPCNMDDPLCVRALNYFEKEGIDVTQHPTDEQIAEGKRIAAQLQPDADTTMSSWKHEEKDASISIIAVVFYAYAEVSFTDESGNQYIFQGHAGGIGAGVHGSYKAIVMYNELETLLDAQPFGLFFSGFRKGGAVVGWGSRGESLSTGGDFGAGAFGGKGKWSKHS